MTGHVALALAVQLAIALPRRNWAAGTMAAICWAISRELAQAEYRWIEHYGAGLRANMPWWGGFDLRVWQKLDPWLDWLVPSLIVIATALLARWRERAAAI